MKNKKGFTLVELIAVVAILAVLVLVALPNVLEIFNKSIEEVMKIEETQATDAGTVYVRDNCGRTAVDKDKRVACRAVVEENKLGNNEVYFCLNTVQSNGYIDEIKYKGKTRCDGIIVYKYNDEEVVFSNGKTYLMCEGDLYKTPGYEKYEEEIKKCTGMTPTTPTPTPEPTPDPVQNEYTVTFNPNGGTITSGGNSKKVKINEAYGALPSVKLTGATFIGWYTEISGGMKVDATTIVSTSNDHVLYAQYEKCQAGTYYNETNASCVSCPSGYTSDEGATAENQCYMNVPAGYYLVAKASEPTACIKGQHQEHNLKKNYGESLACVPCGIDTYQDEEGQATCKSCPTGYKSVTGTKEQNKCYISVPEGNKLVSKGTPTNCDAGTYRAGTKTKYYGESLVCSNCAAGTYSGAGAGSCTKCVAGSYSAAGASKCTGCAGGKTSSAGSSSCSSNCSNNTGVASWKSVTWNTNNTVSNLCSVKSCITNYKVESNKCVLNQVTCPAGQYLPANSGTCSNCPAGRYCVGGTFTISSSNQGIEACGGGKWSTAGSSKCNIIVAGCYGTNGTSSCPNECSIGTFSGPGASSCTACPGTYSTNSTRSTSCNRFYIYNYGTWYARKYACEAGSYQTWKNEDDGNCVDGSTQVIINSNNIYMQSGGGYALFHTHSIDVTDYNRLVVEYSDSYISGKSGCIRAGIVIQPLNGKVGGDVCFSNTGWNGECSQALAYGSKVACPPNVYSGAGSFVADISGISGQIFPYVFLPRAVGYTNTLTITKIYVAV